MVGHPQRLRPRTTFVPADASRLFVRDLGSGHPVIVLHGGPDFDHEYLVPELDGLAEQFRLVFYDQRGRGRSFAGEGPESVTIASEVEDLDRIREWTGSGHVALIGHSWGGLLAMEYAVRHSDRVSHLILMNTAPASHRDMLVLRRELASRRGPKGSERMAELAADPAYLAGDTAVEAEYYRIHFGTTVRRADQLDEIIRRLRVGFTPAGIVAARAIEDSLYAETWSAEGYDLFPELRVLPIPTLVIRGEDDFVPAEVMLRIASAIPRARFVEIADSGHFSYVDRPELVCSTISEFLAQP